MERRLFPSDPAYKEINELSQMIVWAKNPSKEIRMTFPELERLAIIKTLEWELQKRLDGTPLTKSYGEFMSDLFGGDLNA